MDKLFPSMCSRPEKIKIFSLIPFWLLIFIFIPIYMPYLGMGLWEDAEMSSWLEIGYHAVNALAMFLLMGSYLKDEWFMVTTDVSHYLKHIGLTLGLMLAAEAVLLGLWYLVGFEIGIVLECLPVVEMFVSQTPLFLLTTQPIFGTIAFTVFTPITVCSLFYCLGFAPVCYKKPWLAYLCIGVITFFPVIVNILWRDENYFSVAGYIAYLPIHLLACWSYQKTDNVCTPILSLAITNLLVSVVQIILFW
jgi:hypothetical protein